MVDSFLYEIPEGSLPQTQMQENVSKAYLNLVAAAAGLTIQRWDDDYGAVDLSLKSMVDYGVVGGFQPSFDVQLKATTTDLGQEDEFSWQVDRRTYAKLTNTNRAIPACLAVLSVPKDPALWLRHDTDGLVARSHLYWLRASEFPKLPDGQNSVSVRFRKSARFGPAEALEFMEEASNRWT